jgi:hypothetical protein
VSYLPSCEILWASFSFGYRDATCILGKLQIGGKSEIKFGLFKTVISYMDHKTESACDLKRMSICCQNLELDVPHVIPVFTAM